MSCTVLHCDNTCGATICDECSPKCMKCATEDVPLKKVFGTMSEFVRHEKNMRTVQWMLDCHYKFKLLPPDNTYHKINNYRRAYVKTECDTHVPNHTLSFSQPEDH